MTSRIRRIAGHMSMSSPGTVEWRGMNPDTINIDEMRDAAALMAFADWGPKTYPDRKYPVPSFVAHGFAAYAKAPTGHEPRPIIHVDPVRYSSRNGRGFNFPLMMADLRDAKRTGVTLTYYTEIPTTPDIERDTMRAVYGFRS